MTSSLEEPPSYLFALVITKVLILHASVDLFVTYTRDANLWPYLLQRGQMAAFKRNTHELWTSLQRHGENMASHALNAEWSPKSQLMPSFQSLSYDFLNEQNHSTLGSVVRQMFHSAPSNLWFLLDIHTQWKEILSRKVRFDDYVRIVCRTSAFTRSGGSDARRSLSQIIFIQTQHN